MNWRKASATFPKSGAAAWRCSAAPIAPEGDDWNAAVRLRDRVRAEILKHCGEPYLAPVDEQL